MLEWKLQKLIIYFTGKIRLELFEYLIFFMRKKHKHYFLVAF